MTWRPSAKTYSYLGLMVAAIAMGLATGRPEAVVLAVPFALALVVGLAGARPLGLRVGTSVSERALTEGDVVEVKATMTAGARVEGLESYFQPSGGFSAASPDGGRPQGRRPAPGQANDAVFALKAERWGNQEVGRLYLRATSPLGLLESEGMVAVAGMVSVYPRPETLSGLVRSRWSNLAAGSRVGTVKASGLELAGVRPYVPGDRARDVNWRASARYQALYTNERHPERATDVVLALDTFDASTLPLAVRAACALADAYLAQRDRLALVKFGGSLRWLRPGMGLRQRYLVVHSLLSTAVAPSVIWKGVELLPPRILPSRSLVVCLSSLEDPRSKAAMVNMRERGLDVVVVDVPPPVPAAAYGAKGPSAAAAQRLWQMRRQMTRDNFRAMGIPTAEWSEDEMLGHALEELNAWSRRAATA